MLKEETHLLKSKFLFLLDHYRKAKREREKEKYIDIYIKV